MISIKFYSLLIFFFICLNIVSGELAIEPVVSKVSGHIYESRLIKKVIIETSKDPITGQSLSEDDLIPIVGKVITCDHGN